MNIDIRFNNADCVTVAFPDERVTTSLDMKRIDGNVYRVLAVPFLSEAIAYGDLVRVEELQDGTLRVLEVVEKADWRTFDWVLSESLQNAPETQRFCEKVEEAGGYWEQIFGEVLFVCLPPGSHFEPKAEFALLLAPG